LGNLNNDPPPTQSMSQVSSFCHVCGASLAQGAAFCSRCGTAVANVGVQAGPAAAPTQPSWDRHRARHEKHEKQEKNEKNEKGEKHEKGAGGDLAGAITGGLVLVLLGVLLYLAQAGILQITWSNWWQYFIVGVGCIMIVQGLVRYAQRGVAYTGSFIGGVVLILIGFAFISSNNFAFWPLVLVVLGAAAIISAFTGRRRNPRP
jgi:hypothetical protein